MSEKAVTKAIMDLMDPLLDEANCPERLPDPKSPFDRFISVLLREFPLVHTDDTVGIDWFHIVYYRTLRDVLYLGYMLEQKRNRGVFPDDMYQTVENTLRRAFQLGKQYAPLREKKTQE